MKLFTSVFVFCVLLFGVGFALLNHQDVSINYYFGELMAPVPFVLVLIFSIGAVCGLLVGLSVIVKLKFANYQLRKKLKVVQRDIKKIPSS